MEKTILVSCGFVQHLLTESEFSVTLNGANGWLDVNMAVLPDNFRLGRHIQAAIVVGRGGKGRLRGGGY